MKPPIQYPVQRFDDFRTALHGLAEVFGPRVAVTVYDRAGNRTDRTYATFTEECLLLANALAGAGMGCKHVAILSENSYEYLVALFAIFAIGSVAVPIDIEQSTQSINDMVRRADTECVFTTRSLRGLLAAENLLRDLPCILLDSDDPAAPDSFAAILDRGRALREVEKDCLAILPYSPTAPALILYTSGTTSQPKPVLFSQRALLLNAADSRAAVDLPDTIFTSLPFFHIYGLTCSMLNHLLCGADLCVNGDIKRTMRDLALFAPECVMTVPLICEMLLKRLVAEAGPLPEPPKPGLFARRRLPTPEPALVAVKDRVFPHLCRVVCGGAHLAEPVIRAMARFGVQVLQGYGITECAPLVAVNRTTRCEPATVGLPLDSYEIKLDNGELLVRGPALMMGYYKDKEATDEVMTADGWFRTGDMAQLDRRGFLTITGRKKNIIVLKNGKKIAPEELESRLINIPMIRECMVYGSAAGSEADDVVPAVTVYPDPEATAGMASYEILDAIQREIDAVNETLPSYKQIRLINLRESEFEKTATRKIKRGN